MSEILTGPEMDATNRRLYEQDRLIIWATEHLSQIMDEQSLSKADLARLLGTSRAYVTNLLSGRTNLTLRTLADVAAVMDYRIEVKHEPLRQGDFINTPVREFRPAILPIVRTEGARSASLTSDNFLAA
jgi:transcriptional regulator with XRE-family HTH domain